MVRIVITLKIQAAIVIVQLPQDILASAILVKHQHVLIVILLVMICLALSVQSLVA